MITTINDWTPEATHRLSLGSFEAFCNAETFPEVSAELVAQAGPGIPQASLLDSAYASAPVIETTGVELPDPVQAPSVLPMSTWGNLVSDEQAKARIEDQQAALISGGIKVDKSEQFFETGTRMADVGYSTQKSRRAEFLDMKPIEQCRDELADRVRREKRSDFTVSAEELARSIAVNGKVTCLGGYSLTEQAIRSLSTRIESPMLGYLLGLRERCIKVRESDPTGAKADRDMVADVLRHELQRNGSETIKLRARENPRDVFAAVSPSYVSADAPDVLGELIESLPAGSRGTFSYDPVSTAWELRANVWTPTPVDQQAVGEPFQGYASFRSRDNGTSRFNGGGGIMLIRCLNASVYTADGAKASRVHRGKVRDDIASIVLAATSAIRTLTAAWGIAREETIEAPTGYAVQDIVPDFYRSLLTERSGLLARILPGRTETHVKALTEAFDDQRRVTDRLVRSDFAQGFTAYMQDFAPSVQRDTEQSVGRWMVEGKMPAPLPAA